MNDMKILAIIGILTVLLVGFLNEPDRIPEFKIGDCVKGELYDMRIVKIGVYYYTLKIIKSGQESLLRIRVGDEAFKKTTCPIGV